MAGYNNIGKIRNERRACSDRQRALSEVRLPDVDVEEDRASIRSPGNALRLADRAPEVFLWLRDRDAVSTVAFRDLCPRTKK